MNVIDTLIKRNNAFASSKFSADLKIIPSLKTMIIGCVDPRVDPVEIFGLEPGEAPVIRNVGGRASSGTRISRPFRANRLFGGFPGLKPWA